jgi:hypothetical protein
MLNTNYNNNLPQEEGTTSYSPTTQPIDIRQVTSPDSDTFFDEQVPSNQQEEECSYSDSSMSEEYDSAINNAANITTTSASNERNNNNKEMERSMLNCDLSINTSGQKSVGGSNNNNNSNASNQSGSRVNRFFPDKVVDVLNKWFFENQEYPYPDDNMTNILAKEANISAKQVRKWFANKRVRSNKCFKQTCRTKKDRRQTKSIGDEEMFNLHEDFKYEQDQNECNDDLANFKAQQQQEYLQKLNYQYQQQQQQHYHHHSEHLKTKLSVSSHSLSSSASSSTSSSYYSPNGNISPARPQQYQSSTYHHHNQNHHQQQHLQETEENYHYSHQMHRSTSAQSTQDILYNLWKSSNLSSNLVNNNNHNQLSLTDLTNASLSCNTHTNGIYNNTQITAAAVAATAAAVANLLQTNPAVAFQAAITSRLLNLNQQQQQQLTSTSPKSSVKRKTHLSNCFMHDLTQSESGGEQAFHYPANSLSNRSSLSNSPSLSSAELSPCSNSGSDMMTHGTRRFTTTSSFSDAQTLLSLCNYNNQQNTYKYEPQQQNFQSPKPTTVRKINFGDISDLIN